METAVKTIAASRSGERVLEALATLSALLDRTINEVKHLDRDFDARLNHAVQDTELRTREEVTSELTERFQQEMQTVLEASRMEFEAERERISTAMNQAVETSSSLKGERERLNRDLNQAIDLATKLETERKRLLNDVRTAREQAEKEIEKARKSAEAAAEAARASASRGTPPEILTEITQVEGKIREITAVIEDPTTELAVVIRKNVERSELDSYLKGMRAVVDAIGK
jgi:chromosome segregation ATPase